jgi:serine/threonine protein kinase
MRIAVSQHTSLWIGKDLCPGYRLLRLRGTGGFGAVWEAQAVGGERVALKFLKCTDDVMAAQEIRALQFIKQLRHPNLTPVHQVWCQGGYVILTMPLAEASLLDLYDACQGEYGTPMAAEDVLPLLAQVAAALDFLNRRQHLLDGVRVGIQHCDVKPSNVLLFGSAVKLCDYSLSSVTTATIKPHRRAGTLDYAAPEVFQGRLSDSTDQYALAITYCQLRGGQLPFTDTPAHFQRSYLRPAPDLAMLDPDERPVVARALAPTPQQRWPSCKELVSELARCQ